LSPLLCGSICRSMIGTPCARRNSTRKGMGYMFRPIGEPSSSRTRPTSSQYLSRPQTGQEVRKLVDLCELYLFNTGKLHLKTLQCARMDAILTNYSWLYDFYLAQHDAISEPCQVTVTIYVLLHVVFVTGSQFLYYKYLSDSIYTKSRLY
jgi:hypothetical protein